MDVSLIILLALVSGAFGFALWRGGQKLAVSGFQQAGKTFLSMWWRFALGILLGGFIRVLIPGALIAEWLGPTSGLRGILIGSYTALLMTSGPYVYIPIIASVYEAGAGAGPVIALLTASPLIRLHTLLILEIPFFGTRIPLTKFAICLIIPPLVSLAGNALLQLI
jgi:uncharacterized membrane protein YraQ (UPF0718 family)